LNKSGIFDLDLMTLLRCDQKLMAVSRVCGPQEHTVLLLFETIW